MLRQGSSITQLLATQSAATGAALTDTSVLSEFDFDAVTFELNVSQIAATTNTTDVYIQTKDSSGNWLDMVHFAQLTASSANSYFATVPVAGGRIYIGQAASTSISAGAIGAPVLSRDIRVVGIIGGSTPTTSYTVKAWFNHQAR